MKTWQPAVRSVPVRPRTLVRHGEDRPDRVVAATVDCARIVKTRFVLFSILDTMSLRHIHGVRALSGAVLAEVVLIAAAFGWVAIYSYLINPDQPVSVYEQHYWRKRWSLRNKKERSSERVKKERMRGMATKKFVRSRSLPRRFNFVADCS